ncbi:MAG: agmatinase [bacterium]
MSGTNFANLSTEPDQRDKCAIVIIPVPYDATSTWLKGADRGPAALLEASTHIELYDIETGTEVCQNGILTDRPVTELSSPARMVAAVQKRVSGHLADGKFPVVIGGEHSVSIGAAWAHSAKCTNLTVLQLDAHSDLQQQYRGSKYNHACVMARVKEVCPIVQVGIRSMASAEKEHMDLNRTFFAEDICLRRNHASWMGEVVALLDRNVYITVDLDVFDPSIVPSTGTPEPGGMGWYEVLRLMRTVFDKRNVVGFDVVELCPTEHNKAPDFLAAKLVYKMLSYKFQPRR